MKEESIQEIVDSALIHGIVEAECVRCGISIECETTTETAWCDVCEKRVKIKNPLIKLGLR